MSTPPPRTPASGPPRRPAKLTTTTRDDLPPSPTPQPTNRPRYAWMRQASSYVGPSRILRKDRLGWRTRKHTLYRRSIEDGRPELAWRVVRRNPAAFLEGWRDEHSVQDIAIALAASFNSENLEAMLETFRSLWDAEQARVDPTAGLAEQAVRRALTQVKNQERVAREAREAREANAAAAAPPRAARPRPTIVLQGADAGRVTRNGAVGKTVNFFALP